MIVGLALTSDMELAGLVTGGSFVFPSAGDDDEVFCFGSPRMAPRLPG